jgi:hypothetical protein
VRRDQAAPAAAIARRCTTAGYQRENQTPPAKAAIDATT